MAESVMYNLLCLSLIFVGCATCQRMDVNVSSTGICKGALYKNVTELKLGLNGCVVIVGSLEIAIEQASAKDFNNTQFNNLREITEYLVIYRVRGLESIGYLFPNLTRIRGNRLLNNFALIVYDNQNLREIGLFNLLKIDRGGVIIWGLPQACFVETINWKILAPNARHVIDPPDRQIQCNIPCSCSTNPSKNRCWNNKKCQLYLKGPEADQCHDQCLGCRKTLNDSCFACRHYTYKFSCVPECPADTIILPDNKYCVTKNECHNLGRLVWNNTCAFECPIDYKLNNKTGKPICEPCTHCKMICPNVTIQSLGSIQNTDRCVYINGSLTIHLRAIPGAMRDLKTYLGKIQEVTDYIMVEASDVITSLDFLSSLRVIKGKRLKEGKYSLYVNRNHNLQALFSPNVTKNLIIENGTAFFENNPTLCMNVVDVIKDRFPIPPKELDIPTGSNGYSGGCKEVRFNFTIKATSDTSVKITFPIENHSIHYSALYVRLPPGVHSTLVPESCSDFEWHEADVPAISGTNSSIVELKALLPASTYALCIEIYDPQKKLLSRSNIINFTTPVGIPEPPFIVELVASASDRVVISWVDHKDYIPHIKYYEIDVALIEMNTRDSMVDYCKYSDTFFDADDIRHALVRRPPSKYNRGCESMCGILSSVTPGAMAEEHFDVCDDNFDCNSNQETKITNNSTFGNYVRTLILKVTKDSDQPRTVFQVGGLAPFSDYKFRLRACVEGYCSRSARGVVRTFRLKTADIPSLVSINATPSGMVAVKWEPPKVSNGPILTYTVEILPRINISTLMPQVWCVLSHKNEIIVKSVIAPKYVARICLKTLASIKSCSEWQGVIVPPSPTPPPTPRPTYTSKMDLLWTGVLFGISIYIASFVVGWFKSRVRIRSDVVPLVDSTSSRRVESEVPALMLSDFVPFQSITLD